MLRATPASHQSEPVCSAWTCVACCSLPLLPQHRKMVDPETKQSQCTAATKVKRKCHSCQSVLYSTPHYVLYIYIYIYSL